IPDLAATHFPDSMSVLLGNGDGSFQRPLEHSPGPDDGPLAAADLNGDGWADLAVGNQETASVSVLLNDQNWPAGPAGGSWHSPPRAPAAAPATLRSDLPVDRGRVVALLAADEDRRARLVRWRPQVLPGGDWDVPRVVAFVAGLGA